MSEVDKLFFTGVCSCCKQPAVLARMSLEEGVCKRCDGDHFYAMSEVQKEAYMSGKLTADWKRA